MTKQEMIDKIYEEIANKELGFGCIMFSPIVGRRFTLISKNKFIARVAYIEEILELNGQEEIIGHPVMINRVEYILHRQDYKKVRLLLSSDELIKPVEEWNEKAISMLYQKVMNVSNTSIT